MGIHQIQRSSNMEFSRSFLASTSYWTNSHVVSDLSRINASVASLINNKKLTMITDLHWTGIASSWVSKTPINSTCTANRIKTPKLKLKEKRQSSTKQTYLFVLNEAR